MWGEIKANMKTICYTDLFIMTKGFLRVLNYQLINLQ